MATEPINPQDHTLTSDEFPVSAFVFPGGGEPRRPEHYALAEAIHQTFERDEIADENHRSICKQSAVAGHPEPPFSRAFTNVPVDPDTEIDRLARLIVDGEYRRRAEAQNA